jgi:hypothetical protein
MKPVWLTVYNDHDWKLDRESGKFTHPFGPNPKTPARKSVTVTCNFYNAGTAADLAEPKEGDYVFQSATYLSANPSTMATITVNGKSLGSFHGGERSLIVTDLLKPGENEIRLATEAVANELSDNDTRFELLGPMSYNVAKQRFVGKQVVRFSAMEGWTRDRNSGVLHVKGKPDATKHERVIRFTIEGAP